MESRMKGGKKRKNGRMNGWMNRSQGGKKRKDGWMHGKEDMIQMDEAEEEMK